MVEMEPFAKPTNDDLSTCIGCSKTYDMGERTPKFLPCSHCFCLSCIKALMGATKSIMCPHCRKRAYPRGNNADTLPDNLFALQIVKLNSQLQQSQQSMLSVDRQDVGKWCFTCDSAGKSACEASHAVMSLVHEAEDVKSKFGTAKNYLQKALEKRRQIREHLRSTLESLRAKEKETKILIDRNESEVLDLKFLIKNSKGPSPGSKALGSILKEAERIEKDSKNQLTTATKLFESLKISENSKPQRNTSPFPSLVKQSTKIPLAPSASRKRSRSPSTDVARNVRPRQSVDEFKIICPGTPSNDHIVHAVFHPVESLMVCITKSGLVTGFEGLRSSPFCMWIPEEFSDETILNTGDSKAIAWSNDGEFLAVGTQCNGQVVVLEESGELVMTAECHSCIVTLLRWNPVVENLFVSAGSDKVLYTAVNTVTVTDVDAKKTIQTFRLYSQVTCLEWISEDTFATSSEVEGIIQIWKIGEAKSTKILIHGPVGTCVNDIRFSPMTETLFSCCSQGRFKAWSLNKDTPSMEIQISKAELVSTDFHEFATVAGDQGKALWMFASIQVDGTVSVHTSSGTSRIIWMPNNGRIDSSCKASLSFSPKGDYLCCAVSDLSGKPELPNLTVWNTSNWESIFETRLNIPSRVSWDASGKKLTLNTVPSNKVHVIEFH